MDQVAVCPLWGEREMQGGEVLLRIESAPPCRREDSYWPEAKRMALEDRYHSDFGRQARFHGFDHRDRGRYQNHPADRLASIVLSLTGLVQQ